MQIEDIRFPTFYQSQVGVFLKFVRGAWQSVVSRHGLPGDIANANAPGEWAPYLLVKLRRLEKILLWTLVVCATFLEDVVMPKPRAGRGRSAARKPPVELRGAPETWRIRFTTVQRGGLVYLRGARGVPSRRAPDVMQSVARKLEIIRRVTTDPMKVVTRIARQMRRRYLFIGWQPPKRPPPEHRAEWHGDKVAIWELAKNRLWEKRFLWLDSS